MFHFCTNRLIFVKKVKLGRIQKKFFSAVKHILRWEWLHLWGRIHSYVFTTIVMSSRTCQGARASHKLKRTLYKKERQNCRIDIAYPSGDVWISKDIRAYVHISRHQWPPTYKLYIERHVAYEQLQYLKESSFLDFCEELEQKVFFYQPYLQVLNERWLDGY